VNFKKMRKISWTAAIKFVYVIEREVKVRDK
jgi:hypothetical protein